MKIKKIERLYNFEKGETIYSAQVNEELNQLVNAINNTIDYVENERKVIIYEKGSIRKSDITKIESIGYVCILCTDLAAVSLFD